MSQGIRTNPDGSWELIYGDDGDSRLRDPEKNAVPNYRIWNALTKRFEYQVLHRVYCRACGADGGLSARTAVYVVYLCDDCWKTNQDPTFVAMPPDDEYRWRNGLKPEDDVPETKLVLVPK